MLKRLSPWSLSLLSACSLNTSVANYCDEHSGDKLTFDFSEKVFIYTSEGVSDQVWGIIPCSGRIETCFMGEVSFVNPFESAISLNENVVSAERRGDNAFAITTRGAGMQTSYFIEGGDRLPREFRISNLDGSDAGTFVRCWLPFGPSPFT